MGEESGDKKEEGLVEEEKEADVKFLDFDNYNEVLVDEAASRKATRLDNAGIQVHWWDDRIQSKLTEYWSIQDNLKGFSHQNCGQNFEDPLNKFELKLLLRVLRKFSLKIWKRHLNQDFVSWFEKEGKNHDEWLEFEIVGRAAMA